MGESPDTLDTNSNNSLLVEIIRGQSRLEAQFDFFKKARSEDNMELKEALKEVKEDVKKLQCDMANLKAAPNKDKADKWEHYSKLIFDLVLTAAVVVVLIKIGLK